MADRAELPEPPARALAEASAAAGGSRADGRPDGQPGGPAGLRLRDGEVRERVGRLDEMLGRLEQLPGPTAELALDAVAAMAGIYGEALARVMDRVTTADAAAAGGLAAALADDELVGHLLVLHDIHPEPLEARVRRGLEQVRPYLRSHGGDVELAGIDGDVARVRLSGGCEHCASSAATLELAVREAVLALAPELSAVERDGADGRGRRDGQAGHGRQQGPSAPAGGGPALPLIPPEDLLRRPAAAGPPSSAHRGPSARRGARA